jgi:hypothetical protein
VFPKRAPHLSERRTRPTKTTTRRRYATPQQIFVINAIIYYSSDSSLSSTSSISTLHVRELYLTSPQQLQCLSARTLFTGVSPSSRLPPSFSVIKSDTSLTISVSSTYIYRLFQLLRFVSSSITLRIRACSSYSNTILYAICCAPLLSYHTCSLRELAKEPRRLCILYQISIV